MQIVAGKRDVANIGDGYMAQTAAIEGLGVKLPAIAFPSSLVAHFKFHSHLIIVISKRLQVPFSKKGFTNCSTNGIWSSCS